jgi:hypothetical protein
MIEAIGDYRGDANIAPRIFAIIASEPWEKDKSNVPAMSA